MSRTFAWTTLGHFLRVEASADDHPAEVPEAMLAAHDEERFVKVRVVFSQLLLLNFSDQAETQR